MKIEKQLIEQGFKIIKKRGRIPAIKTPIANQINNIPVKPKIMKFLDNLLPYRILKRTTYSNLMDIKNTSEERFKQFMGIVK